jgi:hypothetical protein
LRIGEKRRERDMKKFLLGFVITCMIWVSTGTSTFAGYFNGTWYAWMGTAWDPGPDTARDNYIDDGGGNLIATFPNSGGATWSIIEGSGFVGMTGLGYVNPVTGLLDPTITDNSSGIPYEIYAVNKALSWWASVSGFTYLGLTDGSSAASGALNIDGGNAGDIRIGTAVATSSGGNIVLADSYNPNTEANYGPGGSRGGDITFSREEAQLNWIADPNDTLGNNSYDFFTNVLHEMGHSLGLDHPYANDAPRPSDQINAIMEMYNRRGGAMNALSVVDIYLIQTLYGPGLFPSWDTLPVDFLYYGPDNPLMLYASDYSGPIYGNGTGPKPVPEAGTIFLLGTGLIALAGSRKKFITK